MRVLILGSAIVYASLHGISDVANTLQTHGINLNGSSVDGIFNTNHCPPLFRNSVSSYGTQPRSTSDMPHPRTNTSLTQGLRPAEGGSTVTSFSPGGTFHGGNRP